MVQEVISIKNQSLTNGVKQMMDYVAWDAEMGVAAEVYRTGDKEWRIVMKDTDADAVVYVLNLKKKSFREAKLRAEQIVGFQN